MPALKFNPLFWIKVAVGHKPYKMWVVFMFIYVYFNVRGYKRLIFIYEGKYDQMSDFLVVLKEVYSGNIWRRPLRVFFCKMLNVFWQERTSFVLIHHWSISPPNQDKQKKGLKIWCEFATNDLSKDLFFVDDRGVIWRGDFFTPFAQ